MLFKEGGWDLSATKHNPAEEAKDTVYILWRKSETRRRARKSLNAQLNAASTVLISTEVHAGHVVYYTPLNP
jgi:hypothetical protein